MAAMIVRELAPRCFAPRCTGTGGTTPALWLDAQLVSDAVRLHLVSARRYHSCRCAAALSARSARQPPTRQPPPGLQEAPPQPHAARSGRGHGHKPQRKRKYIDPAAWQLLEELGALGWRCKATPPHRWPPDTLASVRSLLDALLPHIADLPAPNLAHCCWALAQLGAAGGRDPGVVRFVAAVQKQLLTPVHHPYGNRWSREVPAADALASKEGSPGGGGRGGVAQGSADGPAGGGSGGSRGPVPGGDVRMALEGAQPPTHLTRMAPKDLSKLAWGVAKLGIRPGASAPGQWDMAAAEAGGASAAAAAAEAALGRDRLEASAATEASGSGETEPPPVTEAAGDWQRLQSRWWRELGLAAARAIRRVEMPPQAVCNTLWGFATCGQPHRQLLEAAAECIAGGHRTRYEPMGIANLLWAFSTLGFFDRGSHAASGAGGDRDGDLYDRLYDMLVSLAQPLVGAMSMKHLANVAWSLVTARRHVRQPAARQLLAAIAARATEMVAAAADSAAQVAVAAAAMPYDDPLIPTPLNGGGAMGCAVAEEDELGGPVVVRPPSSADVRQYDTHAASLLAWSLAEAAPPGHPRAVSYLDAVVAAVLAVQPGLTPYSDQDLAMLLMAHFRTRHYSAALVRAVRQEVLHRLERGEMEPHALTNICYCLATSNYYNEELYEAVAATAARGLERFGPALASRLVWGLARARHYSPQLLARFSAYIRPRLSECSPADLVASATALAQFHHYDGPLFQGLAAEAIARTAPPPAAAAAEPPPPPLPRTPSPTKPATAAAPQAGAAAAGPPGRTVAADGAATPVAAAAAATASEPLPPRALVNLLWCFAVLSHVDEALLGALLERLRGLDIERLEVPAVMQLCQAQVMLQDLYGGIIKPPEVLTPKQIEVARATWQRVSSGATTISRLQRDVVACLRRLGAQPRCERVTLDGLFSIDTSLEWGGRRVAVEVDGPSHFTCSRPFRPLGRTLAKRRCLEVRGWRVLSVPGHEWRALGGEPDTEDRYMRAALDGCLWRTHVLEGLML